MKQLTLYVRGGCHLCEDMEAALLPYIEAGQVTVERVYIDNDPVLQQRFGDQIPVLQWRGETLCHYFFDPSVLSGNPPEA